MIMLNNQPQMNLKLLQKEQLKKRKKVEVTGYLVGNKITKMQIKLGKSQERHHRRV